jgi:hypothetical protein
MLLDNCTFKSLLSFINNLESKASAKSHMTIGYFCIHIVPNVGVLIIQKFVNTSNIVNRKEVQLKLS